MAENLTIREADLNDPRVIALLETHSRTARKQTGQGSRNREFNPRA
jgi:hypothetical protein